MVSTEKSEFISMLYIKIKLCEMYTTDGLCIGHAITFNPVLWSECITYFAWFFSVDTCSEGDMQLTSGSDLYYPNGYHESSGRVEVCVNGEYIDVCPGSIDVQQLCSHLGYSGIS